MQSRAGQHEKDYNGQGEEESEEESEDAHAIPAVARVEKAMRAPGLDQHAPINVSGPMVTMIRATITTPASPFQSKEFLYLAVFMRFPSLSVSIPTRWAGVGKFGCAAGQRVRAWRASSIRLIGPQAAKVPGAVIVRQ